MLKSTEVIGELTGNHPLLEGKEEFDPRMMVSHFKKQRENKRVS